MHKSNMDTRTLTLIGAALGGIGIALIVDAKKQMSYLKTKQEAVAAPEPALENDAPMIENDVAEAPKQEHQSPDLPKSEPPPVRVPSPLSLPPPIRITIPKQLRARTQRLASKTPDIATDMLPSETYADYHRRIAMFASEYKDESSEEDENSSDVGSESESESDYESGSDSEPGSPTKSAQRLPARLPPATPRQMASQEANPALVHRLRRATAMTEEEPMTRERLSLKPKQKKPRRG